MNKTLSISDELIQLFIDDELDEQERQYVLDVQLREPAVAREISELRRIKDLVKAVRPDSDEMPDVCYIPKQRRILFNYRCAAVSVMLILLSVFVTGLYLEQGEMAKIEKVAATYPDVNSYLGSHPGNQAMRVVLHINRANHETANDLFVQLQQLLQTKENNNRMLRVEIIASGPGLSLVRKNISPYPEQIRKIRNKHDNVVFVACQSTLDRLMMSINKKVQLLPEAMLTASGPDLVRLRKTQGWAYIKI